jgi:hypothetical protein
MDPGVFCPNATLEEIAWSGPESREELQALAHVKRWWARAFGTEVLATLREAAGGGGEAPPGKSRPERGAKASSGGEGAERGSGRGRSRKSRREKESKPQAD